MKSTMSGRIARTATEVLHTVVSASGWAPCNLRRAFPEPPVRGPGTAVFGERARRRGEVGNRGLEAVPAAAPPTRILATGMLLDVREACFLSFGRSSHASRKHPC